MKVTIDSKKGLKTNLNVFVDKKTINERIGTRLIELSKTVNIKGFRPGKVPVDVLKRQFGKAIYGEVLEKVLKEGCIKYPYDIFYLDKYKNDIINKYGFGEKSYLNLINSINLKKTISLEKFIEFANASKINKETLDTLVEETHRNILLGTNAEFVDGPPCLATLSTIMKDPQFDGKDRFMYN